MLPATAIPLAYYRHYYLYYHCYHLDYYLYYHCYHYYLYYHSREHY